MISRYEENEYQTVAMTKLQEILDVIGIKALVTLRAQRPDRNDETQGLR